MSPGRPGRHAGKKKPARGRFGGQEQNLSKRRPRARVLSGGAACVLRDDRRARSVASRSVAGLAVQGGDRMGLRSIGSAATAASGRRIPSAKSSASLAGRGDAYRVSSPARAQAPATISKLTIKRRAGDKRLSASVGLAPVRMRNDSFGKVSAEWRQWPCPVARPCGATLRVLQNAWLQWMGRNSTRTCVLGSRIRRLMRSIHARRVGCQDEFPHGASTRSRPMSRASRTRSPGPVAASGDASDDR